MSRSLFLAAGLTLLAIGALALPQQIKGVKGGLESGSHHYDSSANLNRLRLFNNTVANNSVVRDIETGVCYKEVPTASLVKDPHNVPAGNGSQPTLSRIRTCCKGYERNIYNFRRCEPICSIECVNALCTAPETCTCYADHVRNLAGFCIPTCPIGCQNGECAGGECLCKPGYKLDVDSKFCSPVCENNCGGHGNCTAPGQCACDKNFNLAADGQCRASCRGCDHGDCVGPNQCNCHKGYSKNQYGECVPVCSKGCTNGVCVSPDVCACSYGFDLKEETGSCEPKCLVPCINGVCSGPDTCTCKTGYIIDKRDPTGSICVPNCPGGCPNGVCSGPNMCLCNFGYVKERTGGVKGGAGAACVRRTRRDLSALQQLLTFNIPQQY